MKSGSKGYMGLALYLAAILVLLIAVAPNCAINGDEILHYNHAHKVIDWYESGGEDTSCLETPETNLKYYSQSIDNISALINRKFNIVDEYATRHYIGAVVGWLLLVIIAALAFEITGNIWVSILAVTLFLISPRPMGQLWGNLKDIPFALGYAWGLLHGVRIIKRLPKIPWIDTILLGCAIAFTNSIRFGGFVTLAVISLVGVVWIFKNRDSLTIKWYLDLLLKICIITTIGYFLGLIFWPFGLIDPLHNPLEALEVMKHYKVSIRQIFMGEAYWSTNLPWYYILVWLLISIPEIVLVGIVSCFSLSIKRSPKYRVLLIVLATIFPICFVLIDGANLYSGWRQLYFIYPTFVILSAMGIVEIYSRFKNRARIVYVVLLSLLTLIPITHMVEKFPVEYVYFNQLVGGSDATAGLFEQDYYFHGLKEGVDILIDSGELHSGDVVATHIDITGYTKAAGVDVEFKYIHIDNRNSVEWDYALIESNYVTPHRLKSRSWSPDSVDYNLGEVVVLKGQTSALNRGIKLFKERDIEQAILELERGLAEESNDIYALAILASCYLSQDNIPKVEMLLNKIDKLAPEDENLHLLRSNLYKIQGNLEKALSECKRGIELNCNFTPLLKLERVLERELKQDI